MATVEQQLRDYGVEIGELEAEVLTGRGIAPRKPLLARVDDLEESKALEHAAAAAVAAIGANRKSRHVEMLTYINVGIAAAATIANYFHVI